MKKITEMTNELFSDNKNHVEYFCKDGFFIVKIYNANYEPQNMFESQNESQKDYL